MPGLLFGRATRDSQVADVTIQAQCDSMKLESAFGEMAKSRSRCETAGACRLRIMAAMASIWRFEHEKAEYGVLLPAQRRSAFDGGFPQAGVPCTTAAVTPSHSGIKRLMPIGQIAPIQFPASSLTLASRSNRNNRSRFSMFFNVVGANCGHIREP